MQITNIDLENFRGIEKQNIELLPNINVFVGVNGAGKSTILDAIAVSLSWLVARIQKKNSRARHIEEESIKNDTEYSSITLALLEDKITYHWKNIDYTLGFPSKEESTFLELDMLAYKYQEEYQEKNQLPIIAYYPVNRVAKGISSMMGYDNKTSLAIYDNALGAKANFQAFFNWFREQDDIVNEQYSSRSKWMIKKKSWIKAKVQRLLKILSDKKYNKRLDRFIYSLDDDFFLEEPRFLFHELMEALEEYNIQDDRYISHEVEHLLHRMGRLFDRGDNEKLEINNYVLKDIKKILEHIFHLNEKVSIEGLKENENILRFIWEVFLFATQLVFWQLSQKGRKDIESIFGLSNPIRKMRQPLNMENFIAQIETILDRDHKRLKDALSNQGRELIIVAKTIENFIPEYKDLRVSRIPRPHMLVDKNGEVLQLNQLSDGEKNMIAMIGDIARRLSIANPNMENPLEGDGIVMIDEIDLHLHPSWQRVIISKLTEVFPNCQFIITTHSPQVLSHVKAEHIFLLQQENDNMSITKPTESYGKSSDRQLEDILGVDARPSAIKKGLHELFRIIQEGDLYEAKLRINELDYLIEGSESELFKAEALIKRREILGK